ISTSHWYPTADVPLALVRLLRRVAVKSPTVLFAHRFDVWFGLLTSMVHSATLRLERVFVTEPPTFESIDWYVANLYELHATLFVLQRIHTTLQAPARHLSQLPSVSFATLDRLMHMHHLCERFLEQMPQDVSTGIVDTSQKPGSLIPQIPQSAWLSMALSTNSVELFDTNVADCQLAYSQTLYMFIEIVGQLSDTHDLGLSITSKQDKSRFHRMLQFTYDHALHLRHPRLTQWLKELVHSTL
ncbi:hypothetical protein IWQ62_002033, partial [Dispira parvispora]